MIKSIKEDVHVDRSIEPFHPDYVKLDDRSIEELMHSFRSYAKQIPFIDESGNALGLWSEMYDNEILFLWVDIALIDIKGIDTRKKEILSVWNIRSEKQSLNLMFAVLGILKHLHIKSSLLGTDWIRTEINSVVKDALFYDFKPLRDSLALDQVKVSHRETVKWFDNLFYELNIETFSTSSQRTVKDCFETTIDDANNCLLIIQNKLRSRLNDEILLNGNHPAHIGLLYGFLKSYKGIQDQLNHLSKRHIDYYYKTILQQNPQSASPDFSYVFMQLIPTVDSTIIKEGTVFTAGQDRAGNDINFEAASDFQITQAKIGEIKTLLFNKNPKVLPLLKGNMVEGIYTNSLSPEYIGKELFDNKAWPLFGSASSNDFQKRPDFGWAIASPVFYLTSGIRTVTLTYKLKDLEGYTSIMDELIATLDEDRKSISRVELFHLFLKSAFDIQISSTNGWLTVENYMVAFDEEFSEDYNDFIVQFTLPNDFPGWIPYDSNLHGDRYDTQLPIITFKLNQVSVYFPYSLLRNIKIESVDVNVQVEKFKNISVFNKHGLIDLGQAAAILGTNPLHLNQFHLGSIEWHSKNLKSLICKITWLDLPKPNFETYYKDYLSCSIDDDSFLIELNDNTDNKPTQQLFRLRNNVLINESQFDFDAINKTAGTEVLTETAVFTPKDYPFGFISLKLVAPEVGFGSSIYTNEMALYGQKMMNNKSFKKEALPPNQPFVPYANSIEIEYSSTHKIAFENKSSGGKNETFDFFHIHPHGISKEGDHKKIKSNDLIPNQYGDRGYLYVGLENVKPYMEVSIFLKIVPSKEPRKDKKLIEIDYLSGKVWEPFNEYVIENSTYEGQETGIIRLFLPLDLSSNHPFFDSNKDWIRLSVNSEYIKLIGKCNYINTNVGLVKRKLASSDDSFSTLGPNSIIGLASKNEAIQAILQPFHSFGGKFKEEEKKYYARVSNRLGHKNRMVRPRDYRRMIMEKFSEVNYLKVLTSSEFVNSNGPDYVSPGTLRIIVMPKIEITGDRSTFYVRKKTQREIENYIYQHCPPKIKVKVESPDYEEIEVRCKLVRKIPSQHIPYAEISDILKRLIAPWLFYEKESFKHINTSFSISNLVYALSQHPNVKDVAWCQVIHLSKDFEQSREKKIYHYNFKDTFTDGDIIKPSNGKAILIPAREFKIYQNDLSKKSYQQQIEQEKGYIENSETQDAEYKELSVGCMDIGQTLILSEKIKNEVQIKGIYKSGAKLNQALESPEKKRYFINLDEIIKAK